MPSKVYNIYLSSTWLDLQEERKEVKEAVHNFLETKFVGMEYFAGAREENSEVISLQELEPCDLYIGLLGPRRGSGLVRKEYDYAIELGKDIYWYVMDKEALANSEFETEEPNEMEKFVKQIQEKQLPREFSDKNQLSRFVTTDICKWLIRKIKSAPEEATPWLRKRSYDYSAEIEEFISEYLGTEESPVPFGGREGEIQYLTDWVRNENYCPYMMLAAPAGKGKSALLIHWSNLMQVEENDLAIVFVPVSIRSGTNRSMAFFAALATRLARLYGEEIMEYSADQVKVWRNRINSFLRRSLKDGRKLLVIIDGIDEAADWDADSRLFPRSPSKDVKILVSARYRIGELSGSAWLKRLGLDMNGLSDCIDLTDLSSEGLQKVLGSMGPPIADYGRDMDFLERLFHLTKGDPLITRLFVNDLWGQAEQTTRLTVEDLAEIEPGLEGYFDRWWKEQEMVWDDQNKDPMGRKEVVAMLDLLTFALGPLLNEDIIQITQINDQKDLLYSARSIERAVKPISRFVLGNGVNQGFVFHHARLGYYFLEKYAETEKRKWEAHFLRWGEKTLERLRLEEIKPNNVPGYLLQYLGAHLSRGHRPLREHMRLLDRSWCDAWEEFDGTKTGFLNDVARTKQYAHEVNSQRSKGNELITCLGLEITCMLVEASIRSLTVNIPDELPGWLLQTGKWTESQVLAHIHQLPDDGRKAAVLKGVFKNVQSLEHGNFLKAAYTLKDESARAEVLVGLVPHLDRQNKEKAIAAIQEVQGTIQKDYVLISLVAHLDFDGRKKIVEMALSIQDQFVRARILKGIVHHLNQWGKKKALEAASDISNESTRIDLLVALIPYLDQEDRTEAITMAQVAVLKIENESIRAKALNKLTNHLNLVEKAGLRQAALAIQNEYAKAFVLIGLTLGTDQQGRKEAVKRALEAALAIQEENERAEALIALAEYFDQQDIGIALESALAITNDNYTKARVLIKLIPLMTDELTKVQVRIEALNATLRIQDELRKFEILTDLVPYLDVHGKEEVHEEALSIQDGARRADVLTSLVPHLDQPYSSQAAKEALEAATAIHDDFDRALAFGSIAPHLKNSQNSDALRMGLEAAKAIPDESDRALILIDLIPLLDHREKIEAVEAAWAAGLCIRRESARIFALVGLTPYLNETDKAKVLEETLSMQNEYSKADALIRLIEEVDEQGKRKVLHEAYAIKDRYTRDYALLGLVPSLSHKDKKNVISTVFEGIKKIKDESAKILSLMEIIPHLDQEEKANVVMLALENAMEITDPIVKANALIGLAPNLDPQKKEEAMIAALTETHVIAEESVRVATLVSLVPNLASESKIKVKETALEATLALGADDPDRVDALVSLIPHLETQEIMSIKKVVIETMDNDVQAKLIKEILGSQEVQGTFSYKELILLMDHPGEIRSDLMKRLPAIVSIVSRLGGATATKDLFEGISNVCRWWP